MKKLITGAMVLVAFGATAAVARVRQVEHVARPVQNSGTGVMPSGAQETMPRAARQLARDNKKGNGWMPCQFSLFTPVQWPNRDCDIIGLRLNLLWGTCCNFDGLDIGLVGLAQNHLNGLSVGLVTFAEGDGVGINVGGVNVYGGDFKGLQVGLGNRVAEGKLVQVGLFNSAYDVKGHQVGLINVAEHLEGVQIGVVNAIGCSSMPFLPIVNWYW